MAGPTGVFERDALQVVTYLSALLPGLTWLVALNLDDEWTPLVRVNDQYGDRLGVSTAWADTVCGAHERGEGPATAPVLAAVPGYAHAAITRELTIGAWMGSTIVSAAGVVLGSLCGIQPGTRDPDDMTGRGDLVARLAVVLGDIHDGGSRTPPAPGQDADQWLADDVAAA